MASHLKPHSASQAPGAKGSGLDARLAALRFDADDPRELSGAFARLVDGGFDRLPLPGHGATLERWRALAAVAARDLGLVKLFEGHADALAILAELGGPPARRGSRWAVWAAQARDARVEAERLDGARVLLSGVQTWCSGAHAVTDALVVAWLDGEPQLTAVPIGETHMVRSTEHWHAVGMRATASGDVRFERAPAVLVGTPHAYVRRPGFWQGGAGIGACWFGAAAGLARRLRDATAARPDPYRLAHLGAADVALAGAAALLRETARLIDADPQAAHTDQQAAALRARLGVEAAVDTVLSAVGRALGAAPYCRDVGFARALADLPVFVRQSHAEHDLAALGEALARDAASPEGELRWTL
ncbi:acyl-CoA dehydrogenase [Paraburkholderia sp. MMS20-SJTN17]|uniref:Acyl-CoA dehydrogenase n=1 Tax=Paraburkholderia translucens TaxID=2886945 RepID=A0ABS8K770_9BURK|nr:acyl-CoA dehydrogenase [Paraburkholderia sp. MMS20-SJTN17]MCC8400596.1 acyl-CoA dehydrogenase [Paraburkholderia sp. MMS20-SJTN17]